MNFGGYNDGASQFAGGGFMPSPAPGNQDNTYGGAGGPVKKANASTTLRAVTVRQLFRDNANVDDDHFTVDGVDLNVITIVGRVVSVREEAAKAALQVHDGTSSIEVMVWLNDTDGDAMGRKLEWQPGMYVRVIGHLKVFSGRKSINAYAVKHVSDHNEVTHHFLQTIFQSLHLRKGLPAGNRMPQAGPVGGAYGGAPAGGYNTSPAPMMQQQQSYSAQPTMPTGGGMGGGINDDVLRVYNQPEAKAKPNGLNLEEAKLSLRAIGRNYTTEQVMQALDFLSNEGHLYSTIDDRTFKSTAA